MYGIVVFVTGPELALVCSIFNLSYSFKPEL